jgi:outer membrane protein OmpA-like peptidoglycan-associated protein
MDPTELTQHEIDHLPADPYLKRFLVPAKVLFDKPDTARLKNEKALNQVGKFLEKTPFGLAVVAAYTGMTGEKEKNLVLTQARAMIIRKYLVEKFRIDDTRIKTKGMGEDGQTDANKLDRVEIIVYPREIGEATQ